MLQKLLIVDLTILDVSHNFTTRMTVYLLVDGSSLSKSCKCCDLNISQTWNEALSSSFLSGIITLSTWYNKWRNLIDKNKQMILNYVGFTQLSIILNNTCLGNRILISILWTNICLLQFRWTQWLCTDFVLYHIFLTQ